MKLVLKFTDSTPSFTAGFEAGRIDVKMEQGLPMVDNCGFPIHLANKQLVRDMCIQHGYTPSFGDEYFGEWVDFIGIKNVTGTN